MIICSIGHGYVSKYVLREFFLSGAITIGVTSKKKAQKGSFENNHKIYTNQEIKKALDTCTHLLITAAPEEKGCPIHLNYLNDIKNSNIASIAYLSSTSVYGNYKGAWVNEKSQLRGKNNNAKNRKLAEIQWVNFCKQQKLNYNIFRLGAIYGPERLSGLNEDKKIIRKNDHYFSRIHVQDISRLICKILLNGYKNDIWNLVDSHPSTREDFLIEVSKLKKISFKLVDYKNEKKNMTSAAINYWENNKKVSNAKILKNIDYEFIFPNYKTGLKNLLGSKKMN